jgi:hypothetical protein
MLPDGLRDARLRLEGSSSMICVEQHFTSVDLRFTGIENRFIGLEAG